MYDLTLPETIKVPHELSHLAVKNPDFLDVWRAFAVVRTFNGGKGNLTFKHATWAIMDGLKISEGSAQKLINRGLSVTIVTFGDKMHEITFFKYQRIHGRRMIQCRGLLRQFQAMELDPKGLFEMPLEVLSNKPLLKACLRESIRQENKRPDGTVVISREWIQKATGADRRQQRRDEKRLGTSIQQNYVRYADPEQAAEKKALPKDHPESRKKRSLGTRETFYQKANTYTPSDLVRTLRKPFEDAPDTRRIAPDEAEVGDDVRRFHALDVSQAEGFAGLIDLDIPIGTVRTLAGDEVGLWTRFPQRGEAYDLSLYAHALELPRMPRIFYRPGRSQPVERPLALQDERAGRKVIPPGVIARRRQALREI